MESENPERIEVVLGVDEDDPASHAIACAIDEAKKAKKEGKQKVILFCYSGHGLMDLAGYDKFLSGKLRAYTLAKHKIEASLCALKKFPQAKKEKSGKW